MNGRASSQYDNCANNYATQNASSLDNEYYERPAMIDLAGDVEGRQVLDVGCGAGLLSAALQAKGAVMTGFDGCPAMVELARHRLGPDVPLRVADLAEPLPYPDDAFDDAVASLVLHYLGDWTGPLVELRRVLKPGGRLILPVPHPLVRVFTHREEDYFATKQYSEDYEFSGQGVTMTQSAGPAPSGSSC